MNRSKVRQWTLMFCIPFASLIVLGWQVYLRSHYGLSSWKGGGMGMFASADDLVNRCAKVYLVEPSGSRNPITQFSPDETRVLESALEYPSRKNFLRAARQIARQNWIPARQQIPVLVIDANGEPVREAAESFHMMVPFGPRSTGEEKRSHLEIQFWKIAYDPVTRRARASLAETFVFTPQDLLGPEGDQKKS